MVLSAKVKKPDKVMGLPTARKEAPRKKAGFKLKGPGVILMILLGFIFYSFGGQVIEIYNVQHEVKQLQKQMDDLRVKNTDLRKQIEQLNSDAFIEREAREKLGLVKPGEKIILEAKPGAKDSTGPGTGTKSGKPEIH